MGMLENQENCLSNTTYAINHSLINNTELNSKTLSEILEEDVPTVKETVTKMTVLGFCE